MTAVVLPQPGDLALTYRQPWASLVAAGIKPVENRSWPPPKTLPCRCLDLFCDRPRGADHTPYPFRLWVHAGQRYDEDGFPRARALAEQHGAEALWPSAAPRGLLGSVLVTGCHHADECWKWSPIAPDAGKGGKPVARPGERPGWCSAWAEPDAFHWLPGRHRPGGDGPR